jgi:hypothetical protein
MAERILCDSGISIRLDGAGDRTLVVVKNGVVARFWADTAELEGVLEGFPVQLSALEGSCMFQLQDEAVQVTYSVKGSGSRTCTFPATELREALNCVRLGEDCEDEIGTGLR